MSFLSIASPVQAALPTTKVLAAFKPLLRSLLRAARQLAKSRLQLETRSSHSVMERVVQVNRMARALEATDPGLAAELRAIAARN